MLLPEATTTERLQRSSGSVDVVWRASAAVTRAERVFQEGALKVLLPRDWGRGCPDAVLINTAGGLTGGDRVAQRIRWTNDSAAGVTTQAAERIYRAATDRVVARTRLEVQSGAWAEWLPQETILFDGAALDRHLEIEVAAGGRLIAVEALVLGRLAMGERLRGARLTDRIAVHADGRLAWLDINRLEPPVDAVLDRAALGGGARALATVLYVGDDAPARTDLFRELTADLAAGVTCLPPVVVCRLHDRDALALRHRLVHLLAEARAELSGLPARLPRLWHS